MSLIEFKNLPDTSTPLNAENLNNNFNELDNKANYSTNEIVVGKWIDNKKIYRKVYQTTLPNNLAPNGWVDMFELKNVSSVIKICGFLTKADGQFPIPRYENSGYFIELRYNTSAQYISAIGNGFGGQSVVIILEYTKNDE